jgi:very-short-patch-repair endonuclease
MVKACLEVEPEDMLAADLSFAKRAERLKVTNTWVLFARPRSANLVVQDLEKLAQAISAEHDDARLPEAVAALVSEPANENRPVQLPAFRGVSAVFQDGTAVVPANARDLYFPKPFNDEQVRIVQLLETHDGVVVQGPPGTGKTHTIANIICHWLATGRRVLVTSMKEPALAVLREQLPEEIRPLAISLLASEHEGMKQFEQSIHRIASEVQSVDPVTAAREVAKLEEIINALHARLVRIDIDAGRWAKINLSRIEMEGDSIDPLDAAQEVLAHAAEFQWIPDALGVGPQYEPRFGDDDLARLRAARLQLGRDIAYAGASLPALSEFPDTRELIQAHQDLARFAKLSAEVRSGEVPQLADASQASLTAAQGAGRDIERIKALREEIERVGQGWTAGVRDRLKSGAVPDQFELLDVLGRELETAAGQRKAFLAKPVAAPPGAELDADLVQVVENLAQGRRPFGLAGMFGKADAKRQLESITVNGHAPSDARDWQNVCDYFALQKKWRELAARWNALAPDLGLHPAAADDPAGGLAAATQFAFYRKIQILAAIETALVEQTRRLFPRWTPGRRVAEDPSALAELERAISHHLTADRLGAVWAVREHLHKPLGGKSGRIVDDIRAFLTDVLGNPRFDEPAMLASWYALQAELSRLHGLAGALATVEKVTRLISESGASRYAQLLLQPPGSNEDKLLPEHWKRDWRLRRLATHLASIDSQEEFKKLARLRADLEHDLARAYHDIAVQRTWVELAENATPSVRAALQAYLNAIQKIGKGTGKRAVRYRQDARDAAAQAIAAVPCWIMPHYRVSESLPPRLGCFDLVVIDEASQSDLSALPAILRAQKLLIVGDDKQVSPEGVGLEEQKIKTLMQRFLSEQVPVYRAQMSPERSIYDLAKVVFARSGVMLKEHFRCVAPIIEYSKREFYHHELRPLRLPRASERLDPPLVDVFIEEAQRKDDVNLAEIDFIVGEVRRLALEPRTAGRSIGVVSLLGDEQALKIWDRLNDELGPELLQRHQVACGDARTFQGRERDVMFLSMVSAPNDVGAPLSRDIFAQRFNVAASRARDRMYLVRSVNLEHLSEADRLRRGLIAHFAQPFGRDEASVPHARDRCESLFERELYDWLVQQGYHVTPQVRVGAYWIDLVVEGANDARLAVECDGDKYQGPTIWTDDMRRQRVLERAGWAFWRCFASTFVRRRDDALKDLVSALSARGVEPLGPLSVPPSVPTQLPRARELVEA